MILIFDIFRMNLNVVVFAFQFVAPI